MVVFYYIVGSIIIILAGFILAALSHYMFWYFFRRCKNCKHIMLYRGYRERVDDGYHYFHCKHCGNWEKVSKQQILQELGILHGEE